jgi:hypothetical protein
VGDRISCDRVLRYPKDLLIPNAQRVRVTVAGWEDRAARMWSNLQIPDDNRCKVRTAEYNFFLMQGAPRSNCRAELSHADSEVSDVNVCDRAL